MRQYYLSYKQLHRSLITSGKLTLPLWKPLIYWCRSFDISYTSFAFMSCVFCFRSKVSLYIPLLSESKRDLAKWFQWHSAAFRANDLNCMYSQEMTPWYWYCILICITSFSQSFYNCTVSESSNLIQPESFIITCTVFH